MHVGVVRMAMTNEKVSKERLLLLENYLVDFKIN